MLPTKFRFIWPSGFRGEDFFRNQPIRNKNCLWWPCLLMDQDEMSNLYRGHDIDAFYQDSVHLTKRFQRRRFLKSANQKQELPVVAIYKGASIDAFYQVSVHLAKGFQSRRLKCEKLTDDGRQVMAKANIAFGKVS